MTTKFDNPSREGLLPSESPTSPCLLPGTEVGFEQDVNFEGMFGILPTRKLTHKVARFRQINQGKLTSHHDALEFPDGEIVLLTRMCEGQRARVLQLPATARPYAAHEQTRDSIVN